MMAAKKGIELTDVILIAGVAGGGYLLYKSLGKNSSTITPSQQTDNTNSLMAWIAAMMAQSGSQQQPVVNVDLGGLSGLLNGSGGGNGTDPNGSTYETTDDFLTDMSTVLNASGYSGFTAQLNALNKIDHVENRAESIEEGGYWGTQAQNMHDYETNHSFIYSLQNALNPASIAVSDPRTFVKDAGDRWSNLGTSLKQAWSRLNGKTPSEASGLDISAVTE